MLSEKEAQCSPGWLMVMVLLVVALAAAWALAQKIQAQSGVFIVVGILVIAADAGCWYGFTVVNPNDAKVVTLFGVYKGSMKKPGFWWVNPLSTRRRISLRMRNFESGKLKVNDRDGNPIEIAAIIVWQVVETFEAVFNVDDYENFVHVQAEAALRGMATSYPYDAHEEGQMSLRLSAAEIAERLRSELGERLQKAGVRVLETRISHLAYAAEIASAMLRRQQAGAVVAARQKIVEGAVGMVEMALEELNRKHVVELDEERKAAMVSNLLVVLCSEQNVHPVVNTGTLYQ
jgi:regulator of protease activity HflC (stomatin/prohibitin superfamily)